MCICFQIEVSTMKNIIYIICVYVCVCLCVVCLWKHTVVWLFVYRSPLLNSFGVSTALKRAFNDLFTALIESYTGIKLPWIAECRNFNRQVFYILWMKKNAIFKSKFARIILVLTKDEFWNTCIGDFLLASQIRWIWLIFGFDGKSNGGE